MAEVIGLLREGVSLRAISLTTGAARQTIGDLLQNIGRCLLLPGANAGQSPLQGHRVR